MFFKRITGLLLLSLIPALIFFIILLLILALAIGVGWLLQLALPFTLFEGSLLALIAGLAIAFFMIYRIPSIDNAYYEDDFVFDPDGEVGIPPERFWTSSHSSSQEEWLRYELANGIYDDLFLDEKTSRRWDEKELEQVAIDLADAAIWGVKRLPMRKKISLSKTKLTDALKNKDRWPEYHPFIDIFQPIVNNNLAIWDEVIREIKAGNMWKESMDDPIF